ncbi:MAG TPA: hypothetical protein VGC13_22440 [Longimicrobium sp.]|jgi:hypothetical protein|uniref:hypothetical protein n=1 Tax=Longimicrobium sp. TaxID=2029185 RepID=UPI002ED84B7B
MIHVTVRGSRSSVPKLLDSALDAQLRGACSAGDAGGGDALRPYLALGSAARRAREAVARLIKDAPNRSDVQVQVTADQDPAGGWSATVYVGVIPPAAAAPAGRGRKR